MEGQYALGGSKHGVLIESLAEHIQSRLAASAVPDVPSDTTKLEVLPSAQAFRCRSCRLEFETHREMVVHFKTDEHLAAKARARAEKTASSNDEDSNSDEGSSGASEAAFPRSAVGQSPLDIIGASSTNSPKTSLKVSIRQPSGGSEALFIKAWKVLLGEQTHSSAQPQSMVESFLDLLKDCGKWAVLTLRDGFFAGAVFDAAGKMQVHKTFQRYTTRRKQGGSQAKHDGSSGHAKSAGANLRRAQAEELRRDVTSLMKEWEPQLAAAKFIFLSVTRENKSLFFQPPQKGRGSGDIRRKAHLLDKSDPRVLAVPFITHRPSLKEVKRIYEHLTMFEVSADDVELGSEPQAQAGAEQGTAAVVGEPTKAGSSTAVANPATPRTPLVEELSFCAICLEPFGEFECFRLDCGHKFHAHCASMWLDEEGTCPICRESVGTASTLGIQLPFSDVHLAALEYRNDGRMNPPDAQARPPQGNLAAMLDKLPAHAINMRCGENFETILHCAARNTVSPEAAAGAVALVLGAGADPTVKSLRGQSAYVSTVHVTGSADEASCFKAARATFVSFRAANPDMWDYESAGIPQPESDAEVEHRRQRLREKRRRKRQNSKKKAEIARKAQAQAQREASEAEARRRARSEQISARKARESAALENAELSEMLENVAVELRLTPMRLVELVSATSVDIATSIQSVYELLSAGVPREAVLDSLAVQDADSDDDGNDGQCVPQLEAADARKCAMCATDLPAQSESGPLPTHGQDMFCGEGCLRQFRRNLHANAAAARIKAAKQRSREVKQQEASR
eukprot:INCI12552.1.p1 GENE.INCI12552.1~~INCI12552.1.p1  ORF type:complete len:798 (-),score=168.62 INCI12552.1:212-2605(-)